MAASNLVMLSRRQREVDGLWFSWPGIQRDELKQKFAHHADAQSPPAHNVLARGVN